MNRFDVDQFNALIRSAAVSQAPQKAARFQSAQRAVSCCINPEEFLRAVSMKVHAIILAAGQGTRMKSALPKVLHRVGGRPMLGRVLAAAHEAGVDVPHLVLGHSAEQVRAWLADDAAGVPVFASGGIRTVTQPQQLGTAHAVLQALPEIPDNALVVVLYGDVPLVSAATIRQLIAAAQNGLALVTLELEAPQGYGRILRDAGGRVTGIVEEKEANSEQRAIREVNTGLLAGRAKRLKRWLSKVRNDNRKQEYYLTDVVALAASDAVEIAVVAADSAGEVEGVNDPVQLAHVERALQKQQAVQLQREGLYLADPARFDLRGDLKIGRDVHIDIGCVLEGAIELGDGVVIGPYCLLRNVRLGKGTRVEAHSVLDGATAGIDCRIGPFARLRPGAQLADGVWIGNFVEIKQSNLGEGAKAAHLAYIGDASIGERVNIGAGVITCNYDGVDKYQTTIGADAFIGSDSQLIAPVAIGAGAYVAAGSTIVEDVPQNALAIARARGQKIVPDWRSRKKDHKKDRQ
jgi:bifunctional UDP-N-acetylglucosamine pyrophosphorylase/glucosamine-1-phosphate N-acetyltransferase